MKTPRSCRLLYLFTLMLILAGAPLLASGPARAADSSWTGDNSNEWFDGGNWDNGVPDATINAFTNNGGTSIIGPSLLAPYPPVSPDLGIANAQNLTLGNGLGESGTLNINRFIADAPYPDLYVANTFTVGGIWDTTSTVYHDSGAWVQAGQLVLGRDSDLDPSNNQPNFYFLNTGTLQSQNVMMGGSGFGYLLQREPTCFSVSGDLNLGQNQTGQGLLDKYGGDLQVGGNLIVGHAGNGTYFHGGQTELVGPDYVYYYGGTTTVGGDLILGNASTGSGALDKKGQTGSGDLLQVNGNLYVGKDGSGTYNHGGLDSFVNFYDGGVTNVSGSLILGDGPTAQGYLNQLGGSINVNGDMLVGNYGTGTVDQSGGLMSLSGRLTLGANNYGEYHLSGSGVLQVDSMRMYNGSLFNQTGGQLNVTWEYDLDSGAQVNQIDGTATASYMTLWSGTNYNLMDTAQLNLIDLWIQQGGTFNQAGGTLGSDYSVGSYRVLGGTAQQNGGIANVDLLAVGQGPSTPGSYELTGGALNTNQVMIGRGNADDWYNGAGSGTFSQAGGTHTVYGDLMVGGTYDITGSGTYNLSNNGELYVYGQEIIGDSGSGTFNQYDPTSYHSAMNDLILGNTPDGSGYYNLYDGTLGVGHNIFVGYNGNGTFTQAGGTNVLWSSLILGWSGGASGTYNLQDGFLAVGANERIGREGSGTFNQTGGTHVVAGDLTLGRYATGTGTYNLSEGSVEVGVLSGSLVVGDGGAGTFNHNSGTVSVSGGLILGQQSTGTGYYYQYDGGVTVLNNLIVGAEGFGRYELYRGTLTVGGDFIVGQSGDQWSSVHLGDPYNPAASSTTTVYGNMVLGEWGTGLSETWLYTGHSLTVGQPGAERTLYIGKEPGSWGHFNQQGGDLTVYGNLIIGDNSNPSPQLNVFSQPKLYFDWDIYAAGTTHVTGNMIVGNAGTGLVIHKLGAIQVDGALMLGNQAGSFGEYRLNTPYFADPIDPNLYTGTLTVGNLVVGGGGSGTFKMGGGSLSVQGNLEVGTAGVGQFYQSGGTVNTNNNYLRLGQQATGNGYYELSGGSIDSGALSVGFEGTGNFKMTGGTLTAGYAEIGVLNGGGGGMVQSGGSVTVDNATHPGWAGGMTLGREAGSTGSYEINEKDGPAALTTLYLDVGSVGQGTFTQKAGTVNVPGPIDVGRFAGGSGSYTMSGGTLTTGDLTVGSSGAPGITGALALTNAAVNVSVSNSFTLQTSGQFTAAPGVTVNMTGSSFYNYSTDPDNVDMTQLRMLFSNPVLGDTFEVAGHDYGASFAGFTNNFALGTLELAAGAKLNLVDAFSNLGDGPEALYVYNLILDPGAVLDPPIHLYYVNLINNGGSFGDDVLPQQVVPLPSSLLLLFPSLLGLGAWRRFRG